MYCEKCFVNLEKEQHKSWCPYCKETKQDKVNIEDLFPGINK